MSVSYEDLRKLDTDNVLHPMSIRSKDTEAPLFLERGEGVYVYDSNGGKYLDGIGGLWCVNVGYGRREVLDAMRAQMDKLSYYNTFGDMANEPSVRLAATITRMLEPEGMTKVFFGSGGSDAVESALKLARQYWRLEGQPSKTHIISLKDAYHGSHFGGTSINGLLHYKEPYGPLLPHCSQVDNPFLYRNPWTSDPEELGQICADMLERHIEYIGAHNVAAFIAEPIQGAGGVIVPPANYWPLVRAICDKHDILLIADEVVTGFGRTGSLFGVRGWGVKADIMTFAKGISSAYVPLGATVTNERVAEPFDRPDPNTFITHGYTYSGHPLACAAGSASLEVVERDHLHLNAGEIGTYCIEQLTALVDKYENIGEVRGKGLMIALDLVADKKSKTPADLAEAFSTRISDHCQKSGVLIRPVGPKIILSPPLTLSKENVDELVSAIDEAFAETKYKKD